MTQKGISSILIILIIVGILVLAGGVWYWQSQKEKEIVCPQDAKLCPDGTSVGRVSPACEFAPCPEIKDETANWKTYRNEEYGFEMKYPPNPYRTKYYTERGQLLIESDRFAVSFSYYCSEPTPKNIPVFSWTYLIKVADNSTNLSLKEWVSRYEVEATAPHYYYSEYPNTLDFKFEDIYVGGIKSLMVKKLGINPIEGEGGFIEDKIYIPGKQKIYIIESSWDSAAEIDSSKGQECLDKQTKILNQILSTFKFISQ